MDTARPRILVVDDEEAILETMSFTFEDDYEVQTSTDPRRALDLLDAKGPFAVVLTDQRMPDMSGVEFVTEVWQAPSHHRADDPDRLLRHGRDHPGDQRRTRLRLHQQALGARPPQAGDEAARSSTTSSRSRTSGWSAICARVNPLPRGGDRRARLGRDRARRRRRDPRRQPPGARVLRALARSARAPLRRRCSRDKGLDEGAARPRCGREASGATYYDLDLESHRFRITSRRSPRTARRSAAWCCSARSRTSRCGAASTTCVGEWLSCDGPVREQLRAGARPAQRARRRGARRDGRRRPG